jgi:peroxiredoxin
VPEPLAEPPDARPTPGSASRRLAAGAAALAVAAVIVLGYAYVRAPHSTRVKAGQQAPDLALRSIVGEDTAPLSSFGSKPLFVVFFDTRWPSSQTYIPQLERMYRRYVRRNLVVVGIALDEDRLRAQRFLEANVVTFPVLWDPGGRVSAAAYGVTRRSTSYLLDPGGRVEAVYPDVVDWRRTDLQGQIEKHLSPPPPGW